MVRRMRDVVRRFFVLECCAVWSLVESLVRSLLYSVRSLLDYLQVIHLFIIMPNFVFWSFWHSNVWQVLMRSVVDVCVDLDVPWLLRSWQCLDLVYYVWSGLQRSVTGSMIISFWWRSIRSLGYWLERWFWWLILGHVRSCFYNLMM